MLEYHMKYFQTKFQSIHSRLQWVKLTKGFSCINHNVNRCTVRLSYNAMKYCTRGGPRTLTWRGGGWAIIHIVTYFLRFHHHINFCQFQSVLPSIKDTFNEFIISSCAFCESVWHVEWQGQGLWYMYGEKVAWTFFKQSLSKLPWPWVKLTKGFACI